MLAKLTSIPAFALIAVTAKAHYYSHSDSRLDYEIQKISKKTQAVYDALSDKEEADLRAAHSDSIRMSVLAAEAEAAAAMADKVLVTAALAEVQAALADIEAARNAAEAAQLAAETAQTASETAETAAETAQGLAETAQGLAETARDDAITAQTATKTAETAAGTAQSAAEGFQQTAAAAATATESAQSVTEDAKSSAEGFLTESIAFAATASTNADTASDNATTASGNATTASEKASTVEDQAARAATAATAAEAAATTASQNAGLSLYNSWGIIEDQDYDFAHYSVWGQGQIDKFKYLTDQELISEKGPNDVYFYGTTYTADGDNASCQKYGNVCHGEGQFDKGDVTHYVHIHKGRVFRVYENINGMEPEDVVYFCHDDSCNEYHGAYSSAGKFEGNMLPKENWMYNDGDIIGIAQPSPDAGTLLDRTPDSEGYPFTLALGSMSNWCEYVDPSLEESENGSERDNDQYENYCPEQI